MDANHSNDTSRPVPPSPAGEGPAAAKTTAAGAPAPPPQEPARPPRTALDQVLRAPEILLARLDGPGSLALLVSLGVIAFAGFAIYGVVMGSFSGGAQWWAAPVKVLIGAALCAGICFPSLYIFVSLGGADARAAQVLGMLLGALASTAVLLLGFAPVAWIFSQSSSTVSLIAPIHLLVWLISFLASQRILSAGLRVWRGRRSATVGVWAFVFLITSMQMMTALRPLLGPADGLRLHGERKFFLVHWAETLEEDATSAGD